MNEYQLAKKACDVTLQYWSFLGGVLRLLHRKVSVYKKNC